MRRRIDMDYKLHVINEKVATSASKSGAQSMRSDGYDPSLARRWEVMSMKRHVGAMFRVFADANILLVTGDGGRFGDPPEETNMYEAFAPEHNRVTLLSSQVNFDTADVRCRLLEFHGPFPGLTPVPISGVMQLSKKPCSMEQVLCPRISVVVVGWSWGTG